MALTITPVAGAKSVSGTIREEFFDVRFDSSYPTGGEVVTPRDFGLLALYGISIVGGNTAAMPYRVAFNLAPTVPTDPLRLYVETAGAQVANGTDLSTLTFRVRVTGI